MLALRLSSADLWAEKTATKIANMKFVIQAFTYTVTVSLLVAKWSHVLYCATSGKGDPPLL